MYNLKYLTNYVTIRKYNINCFKAVVVKFCKIDFVIKIWNLFETNFLKIFKSFTNI